MADKKISQLPAASTPLAGTEVLPIVQGGTTDQVSVANLTAGRDVTMANAAVGGAISGSYKLAVYGAITSTLGANYFAGTLGIGTTPAYALDVARGGGAQLLLRAGQSGVSNGFTIISDGTNLTYQFDNGNVKIGTAGKGIDFSANANLPGMTSEVLDWYEEGTWVPTDGSGGGLTFTVDHANYTRIGNLVTVNAYITYPVTASTANTNITLPFTALKYDVGTARSSNGAVGCAITVGTASRVTFRNNSLVTLTNADVSGADILFSFTYTV